MSGVVSDIRSSLDDVALVMAAVDSDVSAVKVKTDKLTFNSASHVTADIRKINNTTVNGDGSGTPWGP